MCYSRELVWDMTSIMYMVRIDPKGYTFVLISSHEQVMAILVHVSSVSYSDYILHLQSNMPVYKLWEVKYLKKDFTAHL
jgi:hypothetical protein